MSYTAYAHFVWDCFFGCSKASNGNAFMQTFKLTHLMDVNGGLCLCLCLRLNFSGLWAWGVLYAIACVASSTASVPHTSRSSLNAKCVYVKLNLIINLIFHRFIWRETSVFTMLPCLFSHAPVFLFTYYERMFVYTKYITKMHVTLSHINLWNMS